MNIVREDKRQTVLVWGGAIQIAQMWRSIQAAVFHLPETGEKMVLSFSKYSPKGRNTLMTYIFTEELVCYRNYQFFMCET